MLRSRILSPRQFQRIGFPCRYESTTVNASPETETKTPKKQKNVAKLLKKEDLIKRWISSSGVDISSKAASTLLTAFGAVVHDACVKEGYEIRLVKFGTFKPKINPEGLRRNVKTGESFMGPETVKLQFKTNSKDIKELKDSSE